MRDALAFVHTAQVHAPTFERLAQEMAPGLRVRHVVHEALLADARVLGLDDAALVARVHQAMHDAASSGARVVVCTCSTIGAIAERTATGDAFEALRIDRAMADRAVRIGQRVLIVAAVESTLAPTTALVLSAAQNAGVEVQPSQLLIEQAWPHFQRGDTAGYIETLAQGIRAQAGVTSVAGAADVIVLAQASMAPVAEALTDLGIEVLSSPAPGVRFAVQMLEHSH